MTIVQFGEWLPDQADFGNPGSITATNVVPTANGYGPFAALNATSSALSERPRGAISARGSDNNARQYCGDAAKLYERLGDTWTDVSKSGGYFTGSLGKWDFTRWEDKILAVNFSDHPQQISLGGAAFSDLTTDLKAKYIAVIGDFVVMGNTFDSTDGDVPNRVRWSAIGDETDYTVSASTLSDFQDLKTGGNILAVLGGEFGLIVMERSIWRMTFVGSPTVFQFDEVLPNMGRIIDNTITRDGSTSYFLSERGFFAIENGTQARPIGANKVDKFVLNDIDLENLDRISTVVDEANNRVLWAYPSTSATNGTPDKILIYDIPLGRWSIVESDVELIFRAAEVSTTLEDLDAISGSIDTLTPSLDSAKWQGGQAALNGFNTSFQSGPFSGSNLTATIDTKEVELFSGRRTALNAFRPVIDGGAVTAKVGTRNRQTDSVTFSSSLTQRSSGRFTTRANARYHRFRAEITGSWTDAIGFQVERPEARKGAMRG